MQAAPKAARHRKRIRWLTLAIAFESCVAGWLGLRVMEWRLGNGCVTNSAPWPSPLKNTPVTKFCRVPAKTTPTD